MYLDLERPSFLLTTGHAFSSDWDMPSKQPVCWSSLCKNPVAGCSLMTNFERWPGASGPVSQAVSLQDPHVRANFQLLRTEIYRLQIYMAAFQAKTKKPTYLYCNHRRYRAAGLRSICDLSG